MKESCFKTTLILDALYKFYQRGFGFLLIFDSTEKIPDHLLLINYLKNRKNFKVSLVSLKSFC